MSAPVEFAAMLAVVVAAGLVRGITGFGGAMVMTPPLSVLLGPTPAVAVVLILETIAALPQLPEARRQMRWESILAIAIPACLAVPVGGLLLVALDPAITRRLIAAMVILFCLGMLAGFRYRGRPRLGTSIALGSISGVLLGATSIGAPPVIIYLLSGPDPAAVTRANLIAYISIISIVGIAMLAVAGIVSLDLLQRAGLLGPIYVGGTWLGGRVFARMTDQGFRRAVLIVLIAVSAGIIML